MLRPGNQCCHVQYCFISMSAKWLQVNKVECLENHGATAQFSMMLMDANLKTTVQSSKSSAHEM